MNKYRYSTSAVLNESFSFLVLKTSVVDPDLKLFAGSGSEVMDPDPGTVL
jgi:hypothetical protein